MRRIELNEDQDRIKFEAINTISNRLCQVYEFTGSAGTGKSVVLHEIYKGLGYKPSQILACAYTGQASSVMRLKGFKNAKTIHSTFFEVCEVPDYSKINHIFGIPETRLVFRPKDPYAFSKIKCIFIDEGSMVPEDLAQVVLSYGIPVVVAGDRDQLGPIAGNPGFLYRDDVPRLTQIVRQQENSPILFLADRARQGLPIEAGQYGPNALVLYEDELTKEMCLNTNLMVCGKNVTKDKWNKMIRETHLGRYEQFPTIGDRLICRQNNAKKEVDGIMLSNGLLGTCASSSDLARFNGKQFYLSFKPDLVPNTFTNLLCDYEYFSAPPNIRANYKNKYARGEKFEYAYCITTHLSQGTEAAQGIYIKDRMYPNMQARLDYTAITRFKQGIIIALPRAKNYTNGFRFD